MRSAQRSRGRGRIAAAIGFTLAFVIAFAGTGAPASAGPGDERWVARAGGPGLDDASSIVVSPDSGRVYVAGSTRTAGTYTTVAYDAGTGTQIWFSRYGGPRGYGSFAIAMALSPDGSTVYVTGESEGSDYNADYATVAYDASTGSQLWVRRYDGPGHGSDVAIGVAVTPDSSRVFVTGYSTGSGTGRDYATIAYDAATGTRLWLSRYGGSGSATDVPEAMGLSPDGSRVYVTGGSGSTTADSAYATIAYSTATGSRLWVRRFHDHWSAEQASGLAVAPDGSSVYVTGKSWPTQDKRTFTTVAYDGITGKRTWVARHKWAGTSNFPAIGVSPDGSRICMIADFIGRSGTSYDYLTVAYDTSGSEAWAQTYNGPGDSADDPNALAFAPDASEVFVTGGSGGSGTTSDYATVAYDTVTGSQEWVARYNGPGNSTDIAFAAAVSPNGDSVYVTGRSVGSGTKEDWATVAYRTG